MKKKNWLLTIAFAVLALTIVSTTVLGGTYAKFVSRVSGGAEAQAAGFLVTGSTTGAAATVMIAPGVDQEISANISYFSQVVTDITVENSVGAGSTGAFSTANWAALVTYYNTYVATGADAKYAVDPNIEVSDLIKADTTAGAADIARRLYYGVDNEGAVNDTAANADLFNGTYTTGAQLPAMIANATAPISASIKVTVSWESLKVQTEGASTTDNEADDVYVDNDLFDTFVGNVIAKLATSATATELEGWKPVGNNVLTLTWTSANEKSMVNTSLAITATQHIEVNP